MQSWQQKQNSVSHWPLLFIATVALLAILSGCAEHIAIPDMEFCGNEGELGADCFHSLSTETRELSPAEWADIGFGQVCTAPSNFAKMKAIQEKLCSKTGNCNYQMKKKATDFMTNVKKIQLKTQSLRQ